MNDYEQIPVRSMDELPRWAYTDEEWDEVEGKTVCVEDGVRMVYDQDRLESIRFKCENEIMDRLGII